MPLMERIKVHSFLDRTPQEQLDFINQVRSIRDASIAKSKLQPVKVPKIGKAKKAPGKKRKTKDPVAEMAKLLKKLSPEKLKAIKESYGMK